MRNSQHFPLNVVLLGENRLILSIKDFEKNDVKFLVGLGDNFAFYAAVASLCYYRPRSVQNFKYLLRPLLFSNVVFIQINNHLITFYSY